MPAVPMFDTHAHLNFKRFQKNVDEIIKQSKNAGVQHILIPGTDIHSSQRAVDITEQHDDVYAAVGIHPHHASEAAEDAFSRELGSLENLIKHSAKVKAIGEIGIDRHVYEQTKYEEYVVTEDFVQNQEKLFNAQLTLAKQYKLSIIVHNREAKDDLLRSLINLWDSYFEGRMVFHCCEPEEDLLNFAIEHDIFIGVDGDITYDTQDAVKKREFIKKVPENLLVLETDSPFILPEPLRTEKKYPNTPINLPLIGEYVAKVRGVSSEDLFSITTENAMRLFVL